MYTIQLELEDELAEKLAPYRDKLLALLELGLQEWLERERQESLALGERLLLILTARVTKAEAAAAFARKRRSGGLSQTHYTGILEDLLHDFMHQYLLVEIDEALVDLAVDLTRRHRLRGYDAVQLAAALTLNSLLSQAQLSPLTFVAADDDLLKAAEGEGLATDNPNRHP